jgi:hypothetical protein
VWSAVRSSTQRRPTGRDSCTSESTKEIFRCGPTYTSSVSTKSIEFATAWGYSRADFEPNPFVSVTTSQWRETCALAGSIAESLMLSAASYLEAAWHSRAIAAQTEPAGMALAQRYLADTSVDTAVSVGHRLINFADRRVRCHAGESFRWLAGNIPVRSSRGQELPQLARHGS